jgi:hypothetical protein
MQFDELRQHFGLAAVVEYVAADDQVKTPQQRVGARPVAGLVLHRGQVVELEVFQQESRRQRMAVAGRDVAAAPVHDQAGQRQAAAELQDAFAFEFKGQHGMGQYPARRPQQPENGPGRGGNAFALGLAQGIQSSSDASSPGNSTSV